VTYLKIRRLTFFKYDKTPPMKVTWSITVVFLCIRVGSCLAQSAIQLDQWPYTVTHYTDENGLPQNSVKSIAADQEGFIWLATESGLVRFDGQDFYTFNKSNTNLSSTRFYTIQPDISGRNNRFYALSENSECLRIEGAVAARDSFYQSKQMNLVPHIRENYNQTFLASGSPNYLLEMGKPVNYIILTSFGAGSFYVLKRNEVEFFSGWKKQWQMHLRVDDFNAFFCLRGNLYHFSANGAIFRIHPGTGSRVVLSGDILKNTAYNPLKKNFRTFWNNVSEQTFILLEDKFYYLERTSEHVWSTRLILSGFDFVANNIRTVHYDTDQKRVFLGSVTSGLFVFSRKEFLTLRFGEKDMDNIFYAQTLYQTDKVLSGNGSILGLADNGLKGLGPKAVFRDVAKGVRKHAAYDGRGMLTDRSGNIWSKTGEVLNKYESKGDRLISSWDLDDEIKTIYEGKNGRIWLGMKFKGLYYIDPIDSKVRVFASKPIGEITFLLQMDESTLWVASQHGLYRLNPASKRQELIKGTDKLNIRSLYVSPGANKAVFIATYEDGVFLYNNSKLVQFPLDANKYLGVAHCIAEDRNGFLWIPTNHGLFQASKSDLISYASQAAAFGTPLTKERRADPFYVYYAKDNGFYTNEFNGGCQPCAIRIPSGDYLSLPSLNGLVWFKPEEIDTELPEKGLFVDRLEALGETSPLTTDTVKLPLNPKQIAFHVTVPYYGNRNNLQLSYAILKANIKPSPADWIKLKANDPVVRFSGLAYGDYTLLVRKVNGFGENNYMIKRIGIIVPPDWYEVWWVKFLCGIGVLAAIYAYTLFRTRYLENRNSELEAQIERRTNRLQETLVALQSSEKELSRQMHIQTRLIASISHDIRTPLKYIVASASRIGDFVGNKEYGMIENIGRSIISSGSRMSQLLENTIGYIKTQVYGQNIQMDKVFLLPIIQEKAALFSPVMKEQSNQFINNVDFSLVVKSNAQLLGIVIHNLIDNANKYTFEGVITVTTEDHDGNLHLIISDTGPGIPDHFIYWLNSSVPVDLAENMPSASAEYNGLGLLIVKEISALIHTPLFVENRNGTRVHLIFTLGERNGEKEG